MGHQQLQVTQLPPRYVTDRTPTRATSSSTCAATSEMLLCKARDPSKHGRWLLASAKSPQVCLQQEELAHMCVALCVASLEGGMAVKANAVCCACQGLQFAEFRLLCHQHSCEDKGMISAEARDSTAALQCSSSLHLSRVVRPCLAEIHDSKSSPNTRNTFS